MGEWVVGVKRDGTYIPTRPLWDKVVDARLPGIHEDTQSRDAHLLVEGFLRHRHLRGVVVVAASDFLEAQMTGQMEFDYPLTQRVQIPRWWWRIRPLRLRRPALPRHARGL